MNTVDFCKTNSGLVNTMDEKQFANARKSIVFYDKLEKKLAEKGLFIYLTSGFRSKLVNTAVGGSKTSTHLTGLAFDFVFNNKKPESAHSIGTLREFLIILLKGDDFKSWCDVNKVWLDQFIIGYDYRDVSGNVKEGNLEGVRSFRNFHIGLGLDKSKARGQFLQAVYQKGKKTDFIFI